MNLGDDLLTMVVLNLEGEIGGSMVLTFNEENGRQLAASLLQTEPNSRPGLERIGAIGADGDGQYPRLRLRERHHPADRPRVDAFAAVLRSGLWGERGRAGAGGPGRRRDTALICRTCFHNEDEELNWWLLFVPSVALRTAMENALHKPE